MKTSTQRLALSSARHPRRTIGAWVVVTLLAVFATAVLLPGALTSEGKPTNNPESERALSVRQSAFPADSNSATTDIAVVRSERYTVDSPQFRTFVATLVADVRATNVVARVRSCLDGSHPGLVSVDRHATILPIAVGEVDGIGKVIDVVEGADADPAFAVRITGDTTLDNDFNRLSQEDLMKGELQFGLPAALVILLFVFGAIVAGLVPLVLAVVSIGIGLGLVSLLAQPFELSVFIVNMLTGMGLALGIDYSLFVISRYREERARGLEKLDAIGASGLRASRAVLFSGTAFVVSISGLLLVPSTIMRSLAVGAIVVGIVSVLAALTLLPALLGLLGDRVNSGPIPFVGRASVGGVDPGGRLLGTIVRGVLQRPAVSLVLTGAMLLAAASPILSLRVGTSGVSTLPDRLSSKQGFLALQGDFPRATTDPIEVVVARNASEPATRAALERLRSRVAAEPRLGPAEIRTSADGTVAVLAAPVIGDAADQNAVDVLRRLRSEAIPTAFTGSDTEVLVGGTTAEAIDYFDSVIDPAPVVFAFVLGLTLVLLTIVFRSLVVAATAVLLNLLSVGAAYGLLVLVFQHGFAVGLLGFEQADTIEAWVPLFLFAVLFGLSMDYQVFLLSRIKEHYDETGDPTEAVSLGVASTARLITGAALIIVAVFAGFARGDLVMFQQMGFGIGIALLLDATLIRSILLPSAMSLLGHRNWYLPRWLGWLPRL